WTSRRLSHSLDALPQRDFMPRVTASAGLTLSCAQWRIGPAQLWDTSSNTLSKARALERARRRLRLPRWVFVSRDSQHKPVPCDLESLRAIRTIERAGLAEGSALVFVEMLPDPDDLLVADDAHHHGDRLVSEILLRLPCDESPQAMAARLAPELARQIGL
ncbi:MAG TPA: lantibiotic dehydratase, partial [Thermomicrobiales bacterium]|nr:lantibiotic dehydratase [Thermomicrobiales bacterium]